MPPKTAATAARIYVISPSGAVPDDGRLEQARSNLARAGYPVRLDPAALRRRQRFAGSDEQRAAAFERAAAQPADIVMISRGGYGMTRLVHLLVIPWQYLWRTPQQVVWNREPGPQPGPVLSPFEP